MSVICSAIFQIISEAIISKIQVEKMKTIVMRIQVLQNTCKRLFTIVRAHLRS